MSFCFRCQLYSECIIYNYLSAFLICNLVRILHFSQFALSILLIIHCLFFVYSVLHF